MTSHQSNIRNVGGGNSYGSTPDDPGNSDHSEQVARYGAAATGVELDEAWLEAFCVRFGHELTPRDILGERRARDGFREAYIHRPEVDDELRRHAARPRGATVLLVGRPLAGKSRALLQLIQGDPALRDALIFLPRPGFGGVQLESLSLPNYSGERVRCVFIFDDLSRMLASRGFERFYERLAARRRHLVLATAQPDSLREAYELLAGSAFAEITIPPLSAALRRSLEQGLGQLSAAERGALLVDETIGSFFFPLRHAQEEYRLLQSQGQARLVELEILRGYKAIRLWRKYHRGHLDLIRDYVAKRLALAEAPPLSEQRWADALAYLGRLGFIERGLEIVEDPLNPGARLTVDKITVDDAYVERIICALEEHERTVDGARLPEAELRRREERALALELLRLYPTQSTYAQLIQRVAAPELAAEIYQEAHRNRATLRPNSFVYNSMLARAEGFEAARAVAADLDEAGVRPHQSTVALLMRQMRSLEQTRAVIELMMRWGIQMPEPAAIFNIAMSKAATFQQAREIYDLCIAYGVAPGPATFATLIGKASSFDEGYEVYTLYRAARLPPDPKFQSSFYTSVLRKQGGDMARALEVVEELRASGLPYDGHVVRQLIDRAESYAEAWAIYRRLAGDLQRLTPTVFTGLLKKASDEREAWAVYEELARAGVRPTVNFLNTLLACSSTIEGALNVYGLMTDAGLQPDMVTFVKLVEKASSFAQALGFLQQLLDQGLLRADRQRSAREQQVVREARKELLRLLTLKAQEEGDFAALLELYHAIGERPRAPLFSRWLQLAAPGPPLLKGLEAMEQHGVRPGSRTLRMLLDRGLSGADLNDVLERLDLAELSPDAQLELILGAPGLEPHDVEPLVSTLIRRAATPAAAEALVGGLLQRGLALSTPIMDALLARVPDFTTAWGHYESLLERGLTPGLSSFTALLRAASTFDQAAQVIAELERHGLEPDGDCYNTLLRKRSGSFATALLHYRRMRARSYRLDSQALEGLLRRAPDFEAAWELFQEAVRDGTRPDAASLALLIANAPTLEQARAVFSQLGPLELVPTTELYNGLLRHARTLDEALALYAELLSAGLAPDGLTLGRVLALAPGLDEGWALYGELRREGMRNEAAALQALVGVAVGERAENGPSQLLQLLRRWPQRSDGAATAGLLSAIAASFAENAYITDAVLRIFARPALAAEGVAVARAALAAHRLNPYIIGTALRVLRAAGAVEDALALARRIVTEFHENPALLTPAVAVLAQHGGAQELAEATAALAGAAGDPVLVFERMLAALRQQRRDEQLPALHGAVVAALAGHPEQIGRYAAVVAAACGPREALLLLIYALREDGPAPALLTAALDLAERGAPSLVLVELARQAGMAYADEPELLLRALTLVAARGDQEPAAATVRDALHAHDPQEAALPALLRFLEQVDTIESALSVGQHLVASGQLRQRSLGFLFELFARAGAEDDLLRLARLVADSGDWSLDTVQQALRILHERGELALAARLATRVEARHLTDPALARRIAQIWLARGDYSAALERLEAAGLAAAEAPLLEKLLGGEAG